MYESNYAFLTFEPCVRWVYVLMGVCGDVLMELGCGGVVRFTSNYLLENVWFNGFNSTIEL